jgi:predicted transcriptional regulator of viral defense system
MVASKRRQIYIICMQKESIVKHLKARGGYARMGELKDARFVTRDIAQMVREGTLEKIKPGLYRLSEMSVSSGEHMEMVDICRAYPKAVICLASALAFHELTTFNPQEVFIALPHNHRPPRISHPPLRVFYFHDRFYGWGISAVKKKYGVIRIYEPEKSICDAFRYRSRVGEDLALEALRSYFSTAKPDIGKLINYAKRCGTKTIMTPYLRALTE